jgi:hypothetical protein
MVSCLVSPCTNPLNQEVLLSHIWNNVNVYNTLMRMSMVISNGFTPTGCFSVKTYYITYLLLFNYTKGMNIGMFMVFNPLAAWGYKWEYNGYIANIICGSGGSNIHFFHPYKRMDWFRDDAHVFGFGGSPTRLDSWKDFPIMEGFNQH